MTPSSQKLYETAEKAVVTPVPAEPINPLAQFVRLFLDNDGKLIIGLSKNIETGIIDHPFFVLEDNDKQGIKRIGLKPVVPLTHIKGVPSIKLSARFTLVTSAPNDKLVAGYLTNVSTFTTTVPQLLNEAK